MADGIESLVDLTDGERMDAIKLRDSLFSKYGTRRDTFANIQSFIRETADAYDRLGLVIEMSPPNHVRAAIGLPPLPREDGRNPGQWAIVIAARNERAPWEVERYAAEVRSGVADKYWDERRPIDRAESRRQKAKQRRLARRMERRQGVG